MFRKLRALGNYDAFHFRAYTDVAADVCIVNKLPFTLHNMLVKWRVKIVGYAVVEFILSYLFYIGVPNYCGSCL